MELLREVLGFVQAPKKPKKPGTRSKEGRPPELKIKPRPNKNLWFDDINSWNADLYYTHSGNFKWMATEDEEELIATTPDGGFAHGVWNTKQNKGITYKKPMKVNLVIPNWKKLKEMIARESI